MKKDNKNMQNYMYYSKVLEKPFNTVEELAEAEEAYYAKIRAKDAATVQKKADAQKVEEAFKALNAARKTYKEDTTALAKEYSESLHNLKKAFELGTKDIKDKLAKAEVAYSDALKAFTEKYPEGYHLTLKDGDFETTISSQTSGTAKATVDFSKKITDLFDLMFRF